ncbi:hypothetical protein EDB81DRAFT_381027 [Dactylonectria macrodidyma]|uniref:Uncharacterized protein n=1 Tax=Dactylonectria macrodidyma TaxID=307937 RepID=A0A9P9F939_9HYPO|nr:hypothetical protein EDB81DRAFT_381027 [Dactylonectria macrodidyma]
MRRQITAGESLQGARPRRRAMAGWPPARSTTRDDTWRSIDRRLTLHDLPASRVVLGRRVWAILLEADVDADAAAASLNRIARWRMASLLMLMLPLLNSLELVPLAATLQPNARPVDAMWTTGLSPVQGRCYRLLDSPAVAACTHNVLRTPKTPTASASPPPSSPSGECEGGLLATAHQTPSPIARTQGNPNNKGNQNDFKQGESPPPNDSEMWGVCTWHVAVQQRG